MFELNGSDTSWLVYADYLEDQDIDATHIREGLTEELRFFHEFIVGYQRWGVGGGSIHVGSLKYGGVANYDNVNKDVGCIDLHRLQYGGMVGG
jgi:hypothetical protein